MTIAVKYFNEVELGALGLVTPKVSGVFDLAEPEVARTLVSGRDAPSDIFLRRRLVTMDWTCIVVQSSHDSLVSTLQSLRGYLNPELGFCTLSVQNRPGQRTWAKCLGFPIRIDSLPYSTRAVEFLLRFERYPYWEDLSATTVSNPTSIVNVGQLIAYPTYSCVVTAGSSTAPTITFTVNSKTFTYNGTVDADDVVAVETDIPDVTFADEGVSPARDFTNTSQAAEFPPLAVGSNTCSKGGNATFTWNVTYRNRYL